jgi:hypothetical protein
MFETLLVKAEANVSTVSSIIKTSNRFRELASRRLSSVGTSEESELSLDGLIEILPTDKEWKVYDHCSVVTRLYAIYERFVEDLITAWLAQLPSLVPKYSDLSDKTQITHRTGVARLLLDLDKMRFQHLCIEDVVRGLLHGVTGKEKYDLVCDAFLLHEQNLRKDKLEEVLANAGIRDTWNWVKNHRNIKHYVNEMRGSQTSAESELNNFIEYRNYAAHGTPIDEILGTEALLDLCHFVNALCEALAELIHFQAIQKKVGLGEVKKIGRITEWFATQKAAVAKVTAANLSIDSEVLLISESASWCRKAVIKSMRLNDIPINTLPDETGAEIEVGIQFDIEVRKKLDLLLF